MLGLTTIEPIDHHVGFEGFYGRKKQNRITGLLL
jgi:hypothetical protein